MAMIKRLLIVLLLLSAPTAAWAIVDGEWSGYYINTGGPFTQIQATWTVPTVVYDGLPTPNGFEAVYAFVGVGGVGNTQLIQIGTVSRVTTGGVKDYFGMYELYPAPTVNIPESFSPGDVITTTLQCIANCSPSSTQTWRMTMQNVTGAWTWTLDVSFQSAMNSVEWVGESLFTDQNNPLANYGTLNWSGLQANGVNPLLSGTVGTPIQMNNPWGQTSMFSVPVHGDTFSLCWGLAPNYSSCIVPGTIVPGHRGFMRR